MIHCATTTGAASAEQTAAVWPRLKDEKRFYYGGMPTGIATLPALPATTAPIGFSAAGLPLGVQVLGPAWEDRTTLSFAAVLEALMPFSPPPGYA